MRWFIFLIFIFLFIPSISGIFPLSLDFTQEKIFLYTGTTGIAKIKIKNMGDINLSTTLSLSQYPLAYFTDTHSSTINLELNPMEERILKIKILSISKPGKYALRVSSSHGLTDTLTIIISYPPSFPGLEPISILFLLTLATGIFFIKNR